MWCDISCKSSIHSISIKTKYLRIGLSFLDNKFRKKKRKIVRLITGIRKKKNSQGTSELPYAGQSTKYKTVKIK